MIWGLGVAKIKLYVHRKILFVSTFNNSKLYNLGVIKMNVKNK